MTTRRTLVLGFIAMNLAIGGTVAWFKLPIYMDSLGIVLATMLLGWRSGVVCALATVVLGFLLVNPYLPFYVFTSLAIVFAVEFLHRRRMYATRTSIAFSGVTLALVAAVCSAPITAFLFGGVTASGADLLTAYLVRTGQELLKSVLLSGVASELFDKLLVTITAVAIVNALPPTFLRKYDLRGFDSLP